jgi:hypothetical protein
MLPVFLDLIDWFNDTSDRDVAQVVNAKVIVAKSSEFVETQTTLFERYHTASLRFNSPGKNHMDLKAISPLTYTYTLLYIVQTAVQQAIAVASCLPTKLRPAFQAKGQGGNAPTILAQQRGTAQNSAPP